jgi:hypothetical protein
MALTVPAWSAAYAPGQQLSSQALAEFTRNPSTILSQNPAGGGQMISRIRDLLASDPATLSVILSLVPNANADQKAAIAAGLAQAAKLYARPGVDPAFAAAIQQAVANTQDQTLILAYAAAAGDQPIGAVGGGGVSGGGVGGQTNGLGGSGGSGGNGGAEGIGGGAGSSTGQFSLSGSNGTGSTITNNSSTFVSP